MFLGSLYHACSTVPSPYASCSSSPVLFTDLWIYSPVYVSLMENSHPFPSDVTWKIPTHLSSLNFNLAPSEKPSSTQSDRMRSLSFHFCIADSVFLGHSTFHLELQLLLLIITENLLNSKQWTKYCMYLCTLAYLILTITQWRLFF